MLVSVLIPAYNCQAYIESTILSVLNQSYKNIEVIIVNDGSTDKTENKILPFLADKRLKYYVVKNGGASKARNIAYQHSSAPLLQFLDADDLLDKDKISNQVEIYRNHGDKYLYSSKNGTSVAGENSVILNSPLYQNFDVVSYFETLYANFGVFFQQHAWLTPRTLIEKAGLWDENITFNDDFDFFSRVVLASEGVVFVDKSVSYYRLDSLNSLSKRKDEEAYLSYLQTYRKFEENLLRYENSARTRWIVARAYSRLFLEIYPKYNFICDVCENAIHKLGFKSVLSYGGPRFVALANIIGAKNAKMFSIKSKKFFS